MGRKIQKSSMSASSLWAFFDKISDVTNLNPAEEKQTAFECKVSGEVVGMAVVDTFPRKYTVISRIAVKKEYRRQGVGTALLNHLSNEYSTLKCEIHKDNTPSKQMFKSFGFTFEENGPYDRLEHYYYS